MKPERVKTNYRGKLLICSTAINFKQHKQYLKICEQLQLPPWENFPHAMAIAICDLVDCFDLTAEFISQQSTTEILCGDWQVGRYAWKLENIQSITEPFAVKGKQGLFNITQNNVEFSRIKESSTSVPPNKKSKTQNLKSSDCWYTPSHIVELVVRVLGEIDLDPCADDGTHIRARSPTAGRRPSHYTDDGLLRSWEGRVFMNPPYSCPAVWMKKLQAEVESLRVTEAMAIIRAATDTNWLSPLLATQPVCFWKGRIKFLDANYQPKLSARQSHVLVYWGDNPQRFKGVFQKYGVVYLPIPPSNQISSNNQMLGESSSLLISPSTTELTDDQPHEVGLLSNTVLSNNNQVLGENMLPSVSPSTQVGNDDRVQNKSLLLTIPNNTKVSINDEVLRENPSLKISPSTTGLTNTEVMKDNLLLSIPADTQVSDDNQVLGESLLLKISPSTTEPDKEVSYHDPSPINSQPTHRKYGEGSGNLSWGYANANSTKKKPIKQLYFEWEYKGMRGKTYVRSHLKERVIELNEAKVPVTEILKLLTYNPKVARILGN
jgi:hypothetical protein